jgi:hypothetical protein
MDPAMSDVPDAAIGVADLDLAHRPPGIYLVWPVSHPVAGLVTPAMNRRALQIQAKEIRHIGVTARPWTKPLRAKGMRVGGGRLSGCRASIFTDLSLDRQRPGVQAGNRQNTGRIRHDRPPTRRGHLEVRKPRLGYWPCMTRACSGWAGTATSPKGSAGQGAAPPEWGVSTVSATRLQDASCDTTNSRTDGASSRGGGVRCRVLSGLVCRCNWDGMQKARGSNPLSSTTGQRPSQRSTEPGSSPPRSRFAAIRCLSGEAAQGD